MGVLGLIASFLPHETLTYAGSDPNELTILIVQVAGALYAGFALLNWSAKGNLIGGIYSRPVALGNFVHFAIVAIALLKAAASGFALTPVVVGAAAYVVFAVGFGYVMFNHPKPAPAG